LDVTTFSIEDLTQTIREELGEDLSVRTIRYYIAEGVLRKPDKRGKFTHAHLDRLKLILRLKQAFLPIPDIREKLQLLSDGDVTAELDRYETQKKPSAPNLAAEYTQRLLAKRSHSSAEEMPPPLVSTSPPVANTETWERITLTPDIEVHVRQPLSKEEQIFLSALLDYAQTLRKR
jgi:DNA-binding transcriptional MerR regulator